MTPYQQAREIYNREECARTFEEELVAHLNNGYVINTPELFMMFRAVRRAWGEECILNPNESIAWTVGQADTWHVYAASGNPLDIFNHAPYPLPYISFERKNRLRFYSYPQMAEKLSQHERIRRTSLLT